MLDKIINDELKHHILQHAKECYPQESCGVIADNLYYPCRNVAENKFHHFEIHAQDLADIEDLANIQAYVHSHPDATTKASELDLLQVELHGMPYVICSYSEKEHAVANDVAIYYPHGYQAPLVGRNYHHSYQDCYTIVRDFYQREFGICIADFERTDLWWEDKNHASLYSENFAKAGFEQVDDLRYGDVILCRVGRTEHINHALIYLADRWQLKSEDTEECFGNSLVLHHPYMRKSVREIYGQQWQERTAMVVRYVKDH